jgi:hypothetical protein
LPNNAVNEPNYAKVKENGGKTALDLRFSGLQPILTPSRAQTKETLVSVVEKCAVGWRKEFSHTQGFWRGVIVPK